ncbi:MAG: Flagellar biosynthetic protein FliQ [Firmicutes bacterium ADurb.Bin354]|jgi:flagellar biosynthetic protein FliQ|nr:MAG: Flagellar biosynthetic protein FliQ [Firmicutes bacterium ADurb.Bin354]SCY00641.1 flagellar biosynthetic protein FliQ [Lachnospiraceae bacterium XPB1003]
MTIADITEIMSQAMYIVIITAAPPLVVSMIIGLLISIFQTVTSIQEQTLTFVPKVLSIFLVLIIFGGWMIGNMTGFMENLWSDFSVYLH